MTTISHEQYEAKAELRFWSHVTKTDTCWLWTGTKTSNGYGRHSMTYPGGKAFDVKAHRYSWAVTHGLIPEGIEIDHRCHVELCVRPSHLRMVTSKQNSEHRTGGNKGSRSAFRGVSWDEGHGKWKARVYHEGACFNLGCFATQEDAGKLLGGSA